MTEATRSLSARVLVLVGMVSCIAVSCSDGTLPAGIDTQHPSNSRDAATPPNDARPRPVVTGSVAIDEVRSTMPDGGPVVLGPPCIEEPMAVGGTATPSTECEPGDGGGNLGCPSTLGMAIECATCRSPGTYIGTGFRESIGLGRDDFVFLAADGFGHTATGTFYHTTTDCAKIRLGFEVSGRGVRVTHST